MPGTLLIPLAAITLLAIALLIWGLRGRRVDDHPLCRRCRYDLCGTASLPKVCPECGRALTQPRSVRIGHRRKRWVTVAIAVLMLAASVGVGGLVSWQKGKDYDWNRAKPVWWLKRDASGDDPARVQTALTEMLRRVNEESLWSGQVEDLVDLALDMQGDTTIPWKVEWGEIIEQAWTQDHVADAQLERYLSQMAQDAYTLRARSPVRQGSLLPYQLRKDKLRCARSSIFSMLLVYGPAEFADQKGRRRKDGPFRPSTGSSGWSGSTMSVDSDTGTYEFRMALRCLLMTPEEGAAFAERQRLPGSNPLDVDAAKTLAEFKTTLIQSVEVVPADVPVVELVTDEAMLGAVRAAMPSTTGTINIWRGGVYGFSCDLDIQAPPLDLAFDVFLRAGDEEAPLGHYVAGISGHNRSRFDGGWRALDLPQISPRTTHVNLVLRPSIEWAEQQYEGFERICGEEILLENVPVVWEDIRGTSIEATLAEARALPLDGIMIEAVGDDPEAADTARGQLVSLLMHELLDADAIQTMLAAALKAQADVDQPWSDRWGDFIELSWAGGHLNDEQLERYLHNAIESALSFRLRSPVRAATRVPIEMSFESLRASPYATFTVALSFDEIRIGETAAPLRGGGSSGSSELRPRMRHRRHTSVIAPSNAATYPVRVRLRVGVAEAGRLDRETQRALRRAPDRWPPLVTQWTMEFEAELDVRPADAELVRLVRDDALRAQVLDALRIDSVVVGLDRGRMLTSSEPSLPPLPIDIFCRVTWRDGDREWRIDGAGVRMRRNQRGTLHVNAYLEDFDPIPETVDVVFSPDPAAAERTLDVWEIWGEEIVIEDVPVFVEHKNQGE